MSELIGLLLSALGRLLMAISRLFGFLNYVEEEMNENSRVGESPMERRLRERRRRRYEVAFIIACLLAVAGGWLSHR